MLLCSCTFILISAGNNRASLAVPVSWKPVVGPLFTKWASLVTPNQTTKYPRPQMVREEWKSLNGLWEFDYQNYNISSLERNQPPVGKQLPDTILVPYPVESSLSGVRALAPNYTVFYRRTFSEEFWQGNFVSGCGQRLLHVERSGWNTSVWADGKLSCNNVGEYNDFTCLIPDSPKEIIIGAYDATEENPNHWQLFGKQQRAAFHQPSGFMYTSSSGIWDTIWTECVDADAYIDDLWIKPDVDADTVEITVDLMGQKIGDIASGDGIAIHVRISDAMGNVVATGHSDNDVPTVKITMPRGAAKTKLWSPGSPYLYNATLTITRKPASLTSSRPEPGIGFGDVIDRVVAYFGFRKISVDPPTTGRPYAAVLLNNKPFYQIGTLDQGWFPDGLYAAATDDALVSDLEALKQMGFNAIRKHMKVDTRRWYYHADRLGFLVWQDVPAWSSDSTSAASILWPEIRHIWKGVRNAPSVVQWEAFNEGWGEGDPGMANNTMRVLRDLEPTSLASSRLLDDASGGRGFGCASGWVDPEKCPNHGQGDSRCMSVFWTGGCGNESDVVDHHHYPQPVVPYDLADVAAAQGKPFLLGEYGGFALQVKGHMWTSTGQYTCGGGASSGANAEGGTADPGASLTDAFVKYNEIAGALLAKGLAGQIFTQTTDIECERNGLLTYDRAVHKADMNAIRRSNLALLANASKAGFHHPDYIAVVTV